MEATISTARSPKPKPAHERRFGFFNVVSDPRTYGALLYMLLSLATGIFYFTWTVTGISLSLGFAILIIGIPFALLFIGSVRVLAPCRGPHRRRRCSACACRAACRRRPSADETIWSRDQGSAHRHPHLVVDVLHAADAAARHRLFRDRGRRPRRCRSASPAAAIYSLVTGDVSHIQIERRALCSSICCTPRRA